MKNLFVVKNLWIDNGVSCIIICYYRNVDRSKVQFDFICEEDSTNVSYDEIKN